MASVEQYLIQFVLDSYNYQYGKNIKASDCSVRSINPRPQSRVAYEVFTNRTDDFLRLRIYMNFGDTDFLDKFRMESDLDLPPGELGDEVFVAFGYFNRYYLESGDYKFYWIGENPGGFNILVSSDNDPVVTSHGEYILLGG